MRQLLAALFSVGVLVGCGDTQQEETASPLPDHSIATGTVEPAEVPTAFCLVTPLLPLARSTRQDIVAWMGNRFGYVFSFVPTSEGPIYRFFDCAHFLVRMYF